MPANWIKITERAAEGIAIINRLDDAAFVTVVRYVRKHMNPAPLAVDDEKRTADDDPDDLEHLERLVGIERDDFLLLLKTLSYVLKRASTFVMRPSRLQSELRDHLQLAETKSDAILQVWTQDTRPMLESMMTPSDDGLLEANTLASVEWRLKVQVASVAQQKERTPIGHLQLGGGGSSRSAPVDLEMNHDELQSLFNQLEAIQSELDALQVK